MLFSTYIINKNSKSYRKVSLEVYAQICCILHYECGYGIAKLQDQFPQLPKATMYRLMKRFIGNTEHHKMIKRNKWQIMRNMKNFNKVIGIFSLVELQDHVGLASRCSNCTIRCFLNRINYNYFYQCRRKRKLAWEVLNKRLKFCNNCWVTKGLLGSWFAWDCACFKTNPCKSAQTTHNP